MSKTLNSIVAVALLSLFPAMSLYVGTQGPDYTQEQAIFIATNFLKDSPTFAFDGMEETIEVVNVDTLRMPFTWKITISFTSRNAGYGDRSDEMVATVLTEHTMKIVVSNGKVLSAVTDDAFDELNEVMINGSIGQISDAEEIALNWLRDAPTYGFDGVDGSMRIVDSYVAESYPEQYFITITFECSHAGYGDRTGEILAQVITEHTAAIKVVNNEVESAVIDGVWDELTQADRENPEILAPENAVSIVIQYLNEKYPEAETLAIGPEWTVSDLTPEGLVGYATVEYSGDGWTIRVGYPVVWKPTYMIDVTNTSGFQWSGSVDQSGAVTESTQ